MNPLRTLLSIFPHPLHAFMSQGRIYVYVSEGPHLENRQPFHDFIFGTRHFRQPLQGRRISRVPKTTVTSTTGGFFSCRRVVSSVSFCFWFKPSKTLMESKNFRLSASKGGTRWARHGTWELGDRPLVGFCGGAQNTWKPQGFFG